MAITFDDSTTGNASFASSLTFSKIVSGTQTFLTVGINVFLITGAPTISSVTFGGAGLTQVRRDVNGNNASEIWYLAAPTAGTANIIITPSTSAYMIGAATSLNGVAQTSPIDANNGATGSSTAPSVALTTTTANSWVIDNLAWSMSSDTLTVSGGQTSRYNTNINSTSLLLAGGTKATTTAGSVTTSWSSNNSRTWAYSSVSIKPVSISSGTISNVSTMSNITSISI